MEKSFLMQLPGVKPLFFSRLITRLILLLLLISFLFFRYNISEYCDITANEDNRVQHVSIIQSAAGEEMGRILGNTTDLHRYPVVYAADWIYGPHRL